MSPQLQAFIEHITIIKALSKASIEAYTNDLSLIEAHFDTPLISLDESRLLEYLSTIKNKRTLNRKLSCVNSFFDFCYEAFAKEGEQKRKYKFAKIPAALPKYLSYEQIMNALAGIDRSTWIGLRDYALILFLYATGTRISECLSIEHSDIEGLWLKIRQAKGEKERIVPVAEEAIKALKIYEMESPFESNYLWLNYQGKPLSRISAYKITKKYLKVSPHVIRHSYATALILGGADLRVVQELLGHSSLMTTQVYTHIQKQNLQETVRQYHPMA